MTNKVKKAINNIWRIWKVRLNNLRDRLYLMDAILKVGYSYGVEIWEWKTWDSIEEIQGRFIKMATGLSLKTPEYLCRMEARRQRMEAVT